jgi:hypothetical protein
VMAVRAWVGLVVLVLVVVVMMIVRSPTLGGPHSPAPTHPPPRLLTRLDDDASDSARPDPDPLHSDDGRQALSYDLAWRRLALGAGHSASAAVVSQLGDSLKSALRHVFRTNTFDDPWLPRSGATGRCGLREWVGWARELGLACCVGMRSALPPALPGGS